MSTEILTGIAEKIANPHRRPHVESVPTGFKARRMKVDMPVVPSAREFLE